MHNYHQCIPQLFVFFFFFLLFSVKVIVSAAFLESKNHAVDVLLALFGPEGIHILQPIQSHILSAPSFSTSDVTISHLHGSSTVPKKPKE